VVSETFAATIRAFTVGDIFPDGLVIATATAPAPESCFSPPDNLLMYEHGVTGVTLEQKFREGSSWLEVIFHFTDSADNEQETSYACFFSGYGSFDLHYRELMKGEVHIDDDENS
jgi:hypothetical protein